MPLTLAFARAMIRYEQSPSLFCESTTFLPPICKELADFPATLLYSGDIRAQAHVLSALRMWVSFLFLACESSAASKKRCILLVISFRDHDMLGSFQPSTCLITNLLSKCLT